MPPISGRAVVKDLAHKEVLIGAANNYEKRKAAQSCFWTGLPKEVEDAPSLVEK